MIGFGGQTQVYLAAGATDLRKQIDGLAALVVDGQAARLQMLDQGIESAVPRHDPKGGGRVVCRELAQVEGQMEVEGVLARASDLHVPRSRAERLHGRDQVERESFLMGADEHRHVGVLVGPGFKVPGLDALVVDQDVDHGAVPASPVRSGRAPISSTACGDQSVGTIGL